MTEQTPTLKINEIAQLKSNPDEYYKQKQEEKEQIIKHPVTEHARYVGNTGTWGKVIDPISEEEMDELTYKDGTKIRFLAGIAEIVTPDGETIKYEGNDRIGFYVEGYETFENDQGSQVMDDMEGPWSGALNLNLYREAHGIICGNFLDGEKRRGAMDYIEEVTPLIKKYGPNSKQVQEKREEYEEIIKETMPSTHLQEDYDDDIVTEAVMELSEGFENKCKTNHFNSSFLTVEKTKETPNLRKGIEANDGWKKEMNMANDDFLIDRKNSGWTIITMREGSNPANCGIDLSVPCAESHGFPGNPNGFFLTAPGQKFERRIIDEKNKIIVQTPYQTGMERHIWG